MKIMLRAVAAATVVAAAIASAGAADMVGWNKYTVQPNSDVLVTLPFTRNVAGTYAVTGKTASAINVAATLTTDQYKDVYYVRFTSGSAVGRWSTITTNSASALTLGDASFLGDVATGDTFNVYPHHTLSSVFPDSMEGVSFLKTPMFVRNTEIIIPSTTGAAINRSGAEIYYFAGDRWTMVGGGFTNNSDDVVLSPQEYFIIRNNDASKTLTFVTTGKVEAAALARSVAREGTQNDVIACTGRPTQITLSELNLGGSAAFATTLGFIRSDELLVFDNSTVGKNKSASAIYFFQGDHWRKVGGGLASFDNELLPAGAALVIRKAANAGTAVTWTAFSPY